MRFKAGEKVIIRSFSKRPEHWESHGEMDKWMGKVVTIKEAFHRSHIKIKEDSEDSLFGWCWEESDFLPIPKPGDRVKLRTWEDIEKQYSEYAIDPVLHLSTRNCFGKIFTVSEVYDNYFQTKEYHRNFGIKFEAIEEVYPKEEEEKMEFTKDMLKSGEHVVKHRNGQKRLYLNGHFVGREGGTDVNFYSSDLRNKDTINFDVMAVYKAYEENTFDAILMYSKDLIWERDKEPIEIPSSEAFAKLKEIYGKEVKIVEDKK